MRLHLNDLPAHPPAPAAGPPNVAPPLPPDSGVKRLLRTRLDEFLDLAGKAVQAPTAGIGFLSPEGTLVEHLTHGEGALGTAADPAPGVKELLAFIVQQARPVRVADPAVASLRPPLGPLRHRFVPDSPVIGYLGLLLTLVGAAFALWARVSLGRDWSSAIEIKQDHVLAQRGPYDVVRHPIYTGILLAMLGTALAIGTLRALAAVGLALMAFLQRAGAEEAFLTQQFGARYTDYKRQVKKIIPLVW